MKASFALALAGSILAVASPIDKRAIHTKYVTDLVLVTVTVDAPTTKPTTHHTTTHHTTPTTTSIKTTSTPPPPPPAPTTTSTPPTTSSTPKAEVVTITEVANNSPAAAATTAAPAVVAPQAAQAPAEVESSTAAPAATTTAASTSSDFGSTAVYHHNLHRTNHSAPAVSWNSDLADYAATVAASCVFAHDLTPGASTGSYGQNIAVYGASGDVSSIDPSKIVAQAITDMWYNGEVWQFPADGYGESNPDMSNFEAWGHFSQVVWVASTEIGCASQYCAPGTIYSSMASWFTVCDYRSEGNMAGGYGENVLPSLGEATVTV